MIGARTLQPARPPRSARATRRRVPRTTPPRGALAAVVAVGLAALAAQAPPAKANACAPAATPPSAGSAPGAQPPAPVVGYPTPSATSVGTTTATLLGSVDTQAVSAQYAFEYGPSTGYGSCTPAGPLPAQAGPQPVTAAVLGLQPATTYHFRLDATSAAGTTLGTDQTFTTVPAPPPTLPRGTVILGVHVGGLDPAAAQAAVRSAFERPLRFSYRGRTWSATPGQLGARAHVAAAVNRALASGRASTVPLRVSIDGAGVRRYATYLSRLFSHPARRGSIRLAGDHALVVAPQVGAAVEREAMTQAIVRALVAGRRTPLPLLVRETQPRRGGKAIVIRLLAQSLTLYDGGRPVLTAPVTTGRPALPTPVGSFSVAWRRSPYTFISPWAKGNPFWYPPTPVTWAMYFHDNDFLHDDPGEPASAYGRGSQYGPYASHGCVHVPHDAMRLLYTTVPDGVPVIVAQT